MLKNYLLVALRTFRRQKGYAALNVVGLAVGLACCLLLFQYVAHERSYDDFNENAALLYRATLTTTGGGADPATQAMNGYALAPALEAGVPEIAQTARVHSVWKAVVSDPQQPDRTFEEDDAFWADPSFLQMFSYPLVAGDASRALSEPGTVVISETAAQRYFGDAAPLGRVLDVMAFGERVESRVVGVLEDVPATSHLQFDFLFPMADLLSTSQYTADDGWGFSNFYTYVQLEDGAALEDAQASAAAVFDRAQGAPYREAGVEAQLAMQPLEDVHLNDTIEAPNTVVGSYRTVSFFALLGLATLVIALVNYVNLATARAAGRAREVGVRKAIGAQRGQLMVQFLTESALTNIVALVLAIGLAVALRPTVSALAGVDLSPDLWTSPALWGSFGLTFVVATLLAGLYPAVVLSSFRPATALKGRSGDGGGQAGLRRGLVVVQFAASVAMVAGVMVVSMQVRHMQDLDLGVDLEQVVVVPAPRVRPDGADRVSDLEAFKDALAQIPSVLEVAASQTVPGQGHNMGTTGIRLEGAEKSVIGSITDVDASFVDLYGLTLVAGRAFASLPPPTPDAPVPVLATESMVATLGFPALEDALGAGVSLSGRDAEIVGVVEDAYWSSAHHVREDAFLAFNPAGHEVSIKVAAAALPQTLAALEDAYVALFPGNPFQYEFADALFDEQYRADRRFATLFTLFAGLAVLIACLGLVGLAAYTAEQRRKEIGVRKVLGASVSSVVGLLSRDFVRLVLVGAIVAMPIAWWAMSQWLEDFAYRIDLGPLPFVAASMVAMLAALVAVIGQSLRAATADPVRALRSE